MLWSLIKVILFVALIAAATLGAGYLMETDGGIRISIAETEFNLGPLQAVIAALLLVLVVWLFIKLVGLLVATLRFLNGDETAISRYFARNRERKGFQALADGMMALASGEGRLAMKNAQKAEKYLHRPDLTNLITAQAAEMAGDHKAAEETYKRLLADDRTRFVGVRGIMKQKLAEGDTDRALKLAEKAFALKPKHEETQDILLRLQAEHGDWAGARHTLGAKLKHGSMPRDVYRRRDAVLALSEAKDVLSEDSTIEQREAAIEANRLSPDLIPAAAMAARSYIDQNKPRYAARVLKKAWEAQPHPDLAAAFAEIQPEETPEQRIKRFQTLTKLKPDHPETRMLSAELYLAAEDFPAARRALGDLAQSEPTARALAIMAAIERGEGADESVVRAYLTRALTASRGPQWVCDNCQSIHNHWMPVCSNCSGFDTLAWRTPAEGEVAMPGSTGMLPLIVGKSPAATELAVAEDVPAAEEPASPAEDSPAETPSEAAETEVTDAEIVEDDATQKR
ncbi:heme biosynthesis HemY N-terminal domain-containing protein [Psychromarinibacter sp. C21-152]|uniref:Heme biosynthesis HemY N-terminal domain-containing protein n=1 Tax=Psychromarinibacter sediminicola TaxID=3033385 RepID=A0AAE3NRU3_9RHOB|nr:heme biosynthesis HemY N-terminal domain-containing protein [Psychromarinibacter sediminicola]MDF0602353.1 heme biosynthesis HemY N-terminal domain-containing protein [Psychromarinibacter sediminicola]